MKFHIRSPDKIDFIFMKSISSNCNAKEWKQIGKAYGV